MVDAPSGALEGNSIPTQEADSLARTLGQRGVFSLEG